MEVIVGLGNYYSTMEDLDGVPNLFNLYRVFYEQTSDIEGAKAYIKQRLEHKGSVIFMVRDHQMYVGFTQLYPTFSSISMKKAWILNDLYVDAEARNQGIGEKLLNKAKDLAMETDAKSIVLETVPDNTASQGLHEKNGYIRDSQFYHYELNLS
ncbi:GNAT family N-acetyltransferase [Oceanobacillus oncorhynchi]|nr:GNAT family N-acetyltransferase [Oceanobacillus oncorhynchi]